VQLPRARIADQRCSHDAIDPVEPSPRCAKLSRSAVHALLIAFATFAILGLVIAIAVAIILVQGQRLNRTAVERLAQMACPRCDALIAPETAASARADWQERTRRAHEYAGIRMLRLRIDPLWRFRCAACGTTLAFDPSGSHPPVDQGMTP